MARPPAEILYAEELARLAAEDAGAARPPGFALSPRAVRRFVLGDAQANISRKFYGDDALVERAIVTLASNRGLMLVGEPGTAKSLLSELLAAAVSGSSLLTIQGTAGTTEDQIKYSFNYARLLAEGPSREALVPAPLYRGLERGAIVRFEEITRCQPEIQDVMISVLSDRVMLVPELEGDAGVLFARRGFNVIATANTRDRGVHEMSSALKRRFNFETVRPLADASLETDLVLAQARALLAEAGAEVEVERDVISLLVTTFHDLRHGRAEDGTVVEKPSTVVSTAEAVAACYSAALDAAYLGGGALEPRHLARQLSGTVFKDDEDDARRLRHYFDVVVKERARDDERWQQFYDARREL
ncbi:MAG: AAA family ATPase [Myxococcales bacterium]|nr:AAA family ATPase [Myxococcales bacterium]